MQIINCKRNQFFKNIKLYFSSHKFIENKGITTLVVVSIALLFSCNPTKKLKENEELLLSNKLELDNKKIDKEELNAIIKQKPNKKILGIVRFHLGWFNMFSKDGVSKIGEPPVVYDSLQTQRTVSQMKLFLENRGYFQNEVVAEKKINKRKVTQLYKIKTGLPYLINDIHYQFNDESIKDYVLLTKEKSLLVNGKNFDIDVLDKERERIKNELKNYGYYYFNNNYITYKVDTTQGNQKVNLTLVVHNSDIRTDYSDTIGSHKKYYIHSTNLLLGTKSKIEKAENLDTLVYDSVSIIYSDKLKFRPKILTHTINFKPKEIYSLQDQNDTYKQLNELRVFKNISFIYEETDSNRLVANLYINPSVMKSFTLEGIGTNTGGDLGVEGNIIYQNKNIFRGAEFLNIKLKGGMEIQRVVGVSQDKNDEFFGTPFNTLEFGPEVSLEIPRFLLPINMENFSKRANPQTNITTAFNFQQRPEYSRNLIQGTFGYSWSESKTKKHFITPFNIYFVKLNLTEDFKNKIIAENNPFLLNSYTDHFISVIQYSFIFNNQDFQHKKNYQYFRFNAETSGNMLSTYNRMTNAPKDAVTNSYNFVGIRYAEYVRAEFDSRFYQVQDHASLVERLAVGVGVPYGNLNVLPFEKGYFGGGSNGVRAWPARRLGPGSLADSLLSPVNQIGELKIEANLEYRFDITKLFEGAFFIDAGNVWILKKDIYRPNAEFELNKLYKDLAIGVGMGLRLDFSFFIFRLDGAVPLKDPSKINPYAYQIEIKRTTLNLGIGYPF